MKCFVIQKNTVRHIIYEYLFVYASAASKRSVVLSPPGIFHFPIGIILMVIHMDILYYIISGLYKCSICKCQENVTCLSLGKNVHKCTRMYT